MFQSIAGFTEVVKPCQVVKGHFKNLNEENTVKLDLNRTSHVFRPILRSWQIDSIDQIKTQNHIDDHIKTRSLIDDHIKTRIHTDDQIKTRTLIDDHIKTRTLIDDHIKTRTQIDDKIKTQTQIDDQFVPLRPPLPLLFPLSKSS